MHVWVLSKRRVLGRRKNSMNHEFNIVSDMLGKEYVLEEVDASVISGTISKLKGFLDADSKKIEANKQYLENALSPIRPLIKKFPILQRTIHTNLRKYIEKELYMRETDFIDASNKVEKYMIKTRMLPETLKSIASTEALLFTLNTAYKLKHEIDLIPTTSLVFNYAKQRLNLMFQRKSLGSKEEKLRYLIVSLFIVGLVIFVVKQMPRSYSILRTTLVASALILPVVGILMYAHEGYKVKEKK